MIEMIATITEDELNNIVNMATTFGVFIGMCVGILLAVVFAYIINEARKKSFKMWLYELPSDDDRKNIIKLLDEIHTNFSDLAKSNTKLMKQWHNDMIRLKTYLSMKWMQE